MSSEKIVMYSEKFSKNTKTFQGLKIQPTHAKKSSGAFTQKRYAAEIAAIEQNLLKHFGDIKDQAASDLCQK